MTEAEQPDIEINGARLRPDLSGALWWPEERTLIVADVHFEKGAALAAKGHRLPAYDTAANLKLLTRLVSHYAPKRLIALGDSFHDRASGNRMDEGDRMQLNSLADSAELIWILGNHDPALPDWLRGAQTAALALGPLIFRHEPEEAPAMGEIAGHLHPCARIRSTQRSRTFRRRAFVEDGTRMILPAFGAFTGGLNACDPAFAPLFKDSFNAWMIGRDVIVRAPSTGLLPDRVRLGSVATN